jgi:hypothetical protein
MADFGIAELTSRKADVFFGRFQQGMGRLRPKFPENRGLGAGRRVVRRIFAKAPSIENA